MNQVESIWFKFKNKYLKKKKENEATALERMTGIMKFIITFGSITGLEFTDDWKVNRRTAFAITFMGMVAFSLTYTFYFMFPSSQNIISIGGCAFYSTVATKMICIMRKHKKYMSVIRFIDNVIKGNPSGRRQRILLDVMDKIHYHFKINISGLAAGNIFFSAYPFYDFIFNGNLTLACPLVIPYIDPQTIRGYLVTTAFSVFMCLFCVTVCVAISSLFFATVDVYDGLVSLIENDFEAFDGMCERNERGPMYESRFRNIMMGLRDLSRLSVYMNDMFGVIATVQVFSSYVVVVTFVGSFFVFDFVGGIGASLSFYTEMLVYCYMGQLLDNTNKRIVTVISSAKWYTYEVKYQKDIMTAIYIAQNQKFIYLANVFPLNFDTGLQITKNIYSIIMFLVSMFD